MPTYDYDCPACGSFEALRRIAERDAVCACPRCCAPAPRVLAGAARLAYLSPATRQALDTNERARHAPHSSRDGNYPRLAHPSGCGCCAPTRRNTNTTTAANGTKMFASQRPWMISH